MERLTERGNPMLDGNKIKEHAFDLYWGLKSYEDAEEQGLLLRLPCKVGDTVYIITQKQTVEPRTADMMFIGVLWELYEKEWFATKEQAEQKLAEQMKGV